MRDRNREELQLSTSGAKAHRQKREAGSEKQERSGFGHFRRIDFAVG
jgi:hypothetical protein